MQQQHQLQWEGIPIRHREFLTQKVKFKKVIDIDDEAIVERIHMNYRLIYLKDTAMARFIEDTAVSTLNRVSLSLLILNHS